MDIGKVKKCLWSLVGNNNNSFVVFVLTFSSQGKGKIILNTTDLRCVFIVVVVFFFQKENADKEKEKEKQERIEASLREREREVRASQAELAKAREKEKEQHLRDKAEQHFHALLADMVGKRSKK